MLKSLTITNYALIASLDISFPKGLIIITGETGAGKSILLGALSLLLGSKTDVGVIKDPHKNCVVEAVFDEDRILRRVIYPTGRSRAFIDDEPVSLSDLAAATSRLIDIHAQHQHLLLSDHGYQLSVLDYFSGSAELLSDYRKKYAQNVDLENQLRELEFQIQKTNSERDYISFQWEQLDAAHLVPGELEELEQEQKSLANAESIRESLSQALGAMRPMETSLSQCIKEAASHLSRSASYLGSLGEILDRLDSCKIELGDIESELESIAEGVVLSPERLQEVDERLSLLYSLMKKHNVSSIEDLITVRDGLDASLMDSSLLEEKKSRLVREKSEVEKDLMDIAGRLSEKRSRKVAQLSEEITQSIQSLEMPMARFEVQLEKRAALNATGADDVRFLFSANGTRLAEVSKVASGGELSRVMLSLKALMARFSDMPTMIFDEIDTGVSGKVADKMGTLIGSMAEHMQIIAITHLPQIASKKGTHFYVYKEFGEDKVAQTKIRELSPSEREVELAKMLSGSVLSEAALENARVLLKENKN